MAHFILLIKTQLVVKTRYYSNALKTLSKMSAENAINTPIVEVAPDAVKQKKPTLAGKYSKLLTFGFWFASIIDNEEMKAQMHTQLRLFGTIEEQTELFERFFAEEKSFLGKSSKAAIFFLDSRS